MILFDFQMRKWKLRKIIQLKCKVEISCKRAVKILKVIYREHLEGSRHSSAGDANGAGGGGDGRSDGGGGGGGCSGEGRDGSGGWWWWKWGWW